MAGDGCVVEVSGETPPKHILRILARVQYQARLTSSSITVTVNMVKRNNYKSVVQLPDNEGVGVFAGGVAFLLQEITSQVQEVTGQVQVRSPWEILLVSVVRIAQSWRGIPFPCIQLLHLPAKIHSSPRGTRLGQRVGGTTRWSPSPVQDCKTQLIIDLPCTLSQPHLIVFPSGQITLLVLYHIIISLCFFV